MIIRPQIAKPGEWLVQCDECGFTYHSSEVREDWKGLYKCKTCWDWRHPQDFVRGVQDDPSVPFTRPENVDDGVTFVSDQDFTITSDTDSIIVYETDLTANRTVTLNTAGFIEGDQAEVVKKDGTNFSIDVDGLQTLNIDSKVKVKFDGSAWRKFYFLPKAL